jgi:hypothetical protein
MAQSTVAQVLMVAFAMIVLDELGHGSCARAG